MTALHAHFQLRNQQAFQRLLDPARSHGQHHGASSSGSGGRSWTRPSPLSSFPQIDVNARDRLGRTVLHLAASSHDPSAPEFIRLLLGHSDINVNLPDGESHWTALHRALYDGNIAAARLLLQRPDIDTSLRDVEGYTAFDLYNSTVKHTRPTEWSGEIPSRCGELYTWGSNRNAALGVGDGDDRVLPELVPLRITTPPEDLVKERLDARFAPLRVRQIAMSRLHTVVITDEPRANVRVCGFGSGGRLGAGQHTQYSLVPLPQFTQTAAAVAVGQDHTLILTQSGEVYSWGLNRFSQLGYVLDLPGGKSEEQIQATTRKIAGAIKNKHVYGVAACKTASACWTEDEVYTWGTNNGQLGFDKAAQPVQVQPRRVTKVTRPVQSVSITDAALACLLDTDEVVCIWNDGHFKVSFPAYSFPSELATYRPPQAMSSTSIKKITNCEDTFAALSSNGELFTFTIPAPPETAVNASKARFVVHPQRVWALRKRFSAVRDVALGVDGSIIICTQSGHVFVRSRNLKAGQSSSAKTFKFQRISYLQRISQVCANATGAFAAIRLDFVPEDINVVGNLIPQDMALVQPYLHLPLPASSEPPAAGIDTVEDPESDDEDKDSSVEADIKQLKELCALLVRLKESPKEQDGRISLTMDKLPFNADLIVHVQSSGIQLPAHAIILAARSSILRQILTGGKSMSDARSRIGIQLQKRTPGMLHRVTFIGCHPVSVLITLVYLYADRVLAIWDPRIGYAIQRHLLPLKGNPAQIKTELQVLASLLELPSLGEVLEAPVKRVPKVTLPLDMARLYQVNNDGAPLAQTLLNPDVVLQLADREVRCHSIVLRARCPLFAAFFDDEDWTVKRWTPEGTIVVNLTHMKWRAAEPVLKYLCCGGDKDMFDVVEHVNSVDELVDYMFEVMAVANELHLHRLMLICSWVIAKRVWMNNACSILTDATHFHAIPLVRLLQSYVAVNMEVFLQSRMLDDLPYDVIKQLSEYVQTEQIGKYPFSRSTAIVDKAMETWGNWLALQDIPQPIVPTFRPGAFRDSVKISPSALTHRASKANLTSPEASPALRPQLVARPAAPGGVPDDEMFLMDAEPSPQPLAAKSQPQPIRAATSDSPSKANAGWKTITSAPRVDLKSVMAEASTAKSSPPKPYPARAPPATMAADPSQKPGIAPRTPSSASGTGSWRTAQAPVPSSSVMTPSKDHRPLPSQAPTDGTAAAGPSSSSRSLPTTPRKPQPAPGMGPVITPMKLPAGSPAGSIRRVSSGKVWSPPPVQAVLQRSPSGPAPMSFTAIQLSQSVQEAPPVKDKRSLVEIQEEERARQVEDDFLRWWAEEEGRVQAEQQSLLALTAPPPPKPKRARPPKGGGGGGKPATEGGPKHAQEKEKGQGQDGDRPKRGGRSRKPRAGQDGPLKTVGSGGPS